MSRAVKIFGDAALGSLFFEGSPHPSAPLGGVVVASAREGSTDRIKIIRSDQFQKNGVDPRVLFKRMRITRIRNKDDQRLVQDLGFNQQQVIDYINDEANRKANEIDFQKDGSIVGSGNTINFTGNVDSVSVSGDVATVAISTGVNASQITGVISSGNLPITSLGGVNFTPGDTDATPAFDLSDAHSLPSGVSTTATGILTSGNSTLRLTLNDQTTVDVDVSALNNVSPVSLAASTSYFYLNNGVQLANNQHNKDNGVVFYGTKVKRGEELVFSVSSAALHVGVWGGGNGITGISNVHDRSNWTTKFRYSSEDTRWQNASTAIGKQGVDISTDIETDANTFAVRFDYDSEKLQLWEIDTAFDWHVATANVAVGATETYIYFSSGAAAPQSTPPESLPGITTHRASEWTQLSFRDGKDPFGPSIHTGIRDDDIWKSNQSLRPGMKLRTLLGSNTGLHHWGVGYGGTTGLGNGPLNPYNNATQSWRISTSNVIRVAQEGTMNPNYTAIDGSTTLNLEGRTISWRYNSDNSWDLFDEDTDEVILTGNSNLDGGDMYPYLFGAADTQQYTSNIIQWEWDWNNAQWFVEHRDWESGRSTITFISKVPGAKPLKTATQAIPTQNNGFYYLGNAQYNVTWGEKMRPGQEFTWTQLADNSHGTNKDNMIIGVLNSDSDAFTYGMRFFQFGAPKEQADQDSGFTLAAGISTATSTSGASMRMQYEYGTNKLVCYKVVAGVRTKLAESTSALDGNPIFISLGGESTRIPTTQGVSVYGWEIAHEPPNYYNPWNNWRIGGFPENTNLAVGIASTGNVLAWQADQVWRHKDGLAAGYKMHWLTPSTSPNGQIGVWSSSNASSGLSNLENVDSYWDWSWQNNTNEEIDALKGWTFNTGNSNYSATKWTDPNPGSTRISLRYHSDNTMDLFDETNNEVIINKSVANDGNPIFLSWVVGGATNTQAQMQDDFFNGGDVGIALTTTAV